jgi:hypothetical protein
MRKTLEHDRRGRRYQQEAQVQVRQNHHYSEWIYLQHEGHRPIEHVDFHMTVHEKFVEDMGVAGIATAFYRGRFYWEGPAARSDQDNGPTLLDIIQKTAVPLQWDARNSNYIVYPVGRATAGWNDNAADPEGEELEPDGYNDAYARRTDEDEADED